MSTYLFKLNQKSMAYVYNNVFFKNLFFPNQKRMNTKQELISELSRFCFTFLVDLFNDLLKECQLGSSTSFYILSVMGCHFGSTT